MTARQLALGFPKAPPRYARKDFLVGHSNAEALAVADAFLSGAEPALAIVGPPASGKSHLAHILAARAGTEVGGPVRVDAAPSGTAIILDDADRIEDPGRLLLLVERSREAGVKLALAGAGEPRDWARGLADLSTRLGAMARASLFEPDEALMRAVMVKGFTKRGLRVAPAVIDYAAPRLPRTFAAVRTFLDLAEGELQATGAAITVALARKVLEHLPEEIGGS